MRGRWRTHETKHIYINESRTEGLGTEGMMSSVGQDLDGEKFDKQMRNLKRWEIAALVVAAICAMALVAVLFG